MTFLGAVELITQHGYFDSQFENANRLSTIADVDWLIAIGEGNAVLLLELLGVSHSWRYQLGKGNARTLPLSQDSP